MRNSRIVVMRAMCVILLVVSSGCAWTPKPYADDPLIRTKTALPGDPYAVPDSKSVEPPTPPEPPAERVAHV